MWYGWLFERGAWECVVQNAASLGACSRLLDRVCAERGVNANTHTAMTSGGYPRWQPSGRGRATAPATTDAEGV